MIRRKDGFTGERAFVLPASVVDHLEENPLTSILYLTDIGYYPHAEYHFRERTVPIAQYVYIHCVNGRGWYSVGDDRYNVGPNQYFILPADVAHAYGSDPDEPWTIYWIHFKGKLARYFMPEHPGPVDVRPGQHSRISDRIKLFDEIMGVLELGYSSDNLRYACSTLFHYLGTLRYIQPYREASHDDDRDIVTAAIYFMKENIGRRLSLRDITDHIGYSPSYFSAIFHHRTGYSPVTYFNQLKIQHACELLDFTDMKINQICHQIGIDDAYYFSRMFRKIMGMSASEYKELRKG